MSFWPNKGDADPRPPLGSGYQRIKAVMPHKPIVPRGRRASRARTQRRRMSYRSIPTDGNGDCNRGEPR